MEDFQHSGTVNVPAEEPYSIRRARCLRIERRYECQLYAHVVQDGFQVPCYVLDISASGAQLRFDSLSIRSIHTRDIAIDIPNIGRYPASFRWRSSAKAGVMFTFHESRKAALKARLLDVFDPEYSGGSVTLTG